MTAVCISTFIMIGNNSRPQTPTDDDCCGNGCDPCVFDVHKKLMKEWEQKKVHGDNKDVQTNNYLNPLSYKIFIIKKIEFVADEYLRIQLKCNSLENNLKVSLNCGQHVMLAAKNKNKSKAYTPIAWAHNTLELLVKIYPHGEMSNYLKNACIADEIQVRGPYGNFAYKQNSFRNVVGFCIGSGIAAIYPIARSIIDDEDEETKFCLVAGFRKMSRVPVKTELRLLADYWNFRCILQISDLSQDEALMSGIETRRGRINENIFVDTLKDRSSENTLILICGTPEFNETLEVWTKNHNFDNYHVFS